MSVTLQPHQENALKELHNGSILTGDVGSGKTYVACAYYIQSESPRDVYVITTAKKRDDLDWERSFVKFGVGSARDATLHGVLTVDSWNNIKKYADVRGAFFIFDEQRLVGTGAWTKAFFKIAKQNRWVLLSATPGDTWLDYMPVFIANGFHKNITEFKRDHVVYSYHAKFPKVERYLGVGKLVRQRNSILVEMPYTRHTVRRITWKAVDHRADVLETVTKKRWNVYEDKPLRDVADLFRVARKVVNSDTSRLEAVRQLLHVHPRLVVFYNFDYELEILRTLNPKYSKGESFGIKGEPMESSLQATPSGFEKRCLRCSMKSSGEQPTQMLAHQSTEVGSSTQLKQKTQHDCETCTSAFGTSNEGDFDDLIVHEWNGHKHEPIPKGDRWVYLVQYTAGSEGWNCVTTDAMVFYSLTYSYKQWHQAYGRIDRMNTPYQELFYYPLVSTAWIDLAIKKALRSKKNFNEKALGYKFDT